MSRPGEASARDVKRSASAPVSWLPCGYTRSVPAERGERPDVGREPGVEDVVVLAQRDAGRQLMLGAHFGLVAPDVDAAGLVVPGRDAMPPPQLARDAPVLDVVEPLVVGRHPVL